MMSREARTEAALIAAVFVLGLALRLVSLSRQAVEHFDEGIYSSVLWYDAAFGTEYPQRHLYAPPLLGELIRLADLVPGLRGSAPFLPAVIAGSASVLVLWWLVRSWFGRSAGLFVACIVACSDFHILYSQMALTDVPALCFICGSAALGVSGVHFRSGWRMSAAGIVCGIAWWTKYTGWLPLAIVWSGTIFWWVWRGRREIRLDRLLRLLLIMGLAALTVWAPWLWQLRGHGGYGAVAANHASYLGGWTAWQRNLSLHLAMQFLLSGMAGSLSVGLGMLVAGCDRWITAKGSTWNQSGSASATRQGFESGGFPPRPLLLRYLTAAAAMFLIALSVWPPLLLCCLGIGGVSGIVLWPVLQRQFRRRQTQDVSPPEPGAWPFTGADLVCAPRIDPTLGVSVVITWFVGMMVTTPLYHPYPRLFLPLLASIWVASAAGVGWWIESCLSVARRPKPDWQSNRLNSAARFLVGIMLLTAVAFSSYTATDVLETPIFQDRRSLVTAAGEIARKCVGSIRTVAPEQLPPMTPDDLRSERLVVYGFGEPALLYQLNRLGVAVAPVSHLNLTSNEERSARVAEFLVVGPYARRTSNFWEDFLSHTGQFEFVGEVPYRPGAIVLLNLFSPRWLRDHPEARTQSLELYRIVSSQTR